MIKDKTIYFGYGTVAVGHDSFRETMIFTEIKPPQEIGSILNDLIKEDKIILGEKVVIELDDISCDIIEELNNIKLLDNKQIEIGDYILDFNNYNAGSIDVVKEHVNALYAAITMCLAC